MVGDSLSAAYGIPRNRGWVALLEERLKREHPDYIVVNASISGETSSGGRARLAKLLERHRPVIVVLELGANDGLRGVPVESMKANLETIITGARTRGVRVLLTGMEAPPNHGPVYTAEFRQAYRDLAREHDVAFVPFYLEGVAGNPALNIADGIHPNEEGTAIVERTVWQALEPLLEKSAR